MNRTEEWYYEVGWRAINEWLTSFASKNYNISYVCNLESIPEWIDKQALIKAFNADSRSWALGLDIEGDLVCHRIK